METPKYQIGDVVYFMNDSKIQSDEIVGIKSRDSGNVKTSERCPQCGVENWGKNKYEGFVYLRLGLRERVTRAHSFSGGEEVIMRDEWLEEDQIFRTKEDLINSL